MKKKKAQVKPRTFPKVDIVVIDGDRYRRIQFTDRLVTLRILPKK